MKKNAHCHPPIRVGLLTTDSVNEMYANTIASRTGDLVITAPKLDSLQKAGVDVIVYDLDHLRMFGDPLDQVVAGAARLQVAFGYDISAADVRMLRRRGVIVCRRLKNAVRIVTALLRKSSVAAA